MKMTEVFSDFENHAYVRKDRIAELWCAALLEKEEEREDGDKSILRDENH